VNCTGNADTRHRAQPLDGDAKTDDETGRTSGGRSGQRSGWQKVRILARRAHQRAGPSQRAAFYRRLWPLSLLAIACSQAAGNRNSAAHAPRPGDGLVYGGYDVLVLRSLGLLAIPGGALRRYFRLLATLIGLNPGPAALVRPSVALLRPVEWLRGDAWLSAFPVVTAPMPWRVAGLDRLARWLGVYACPSTVWSSPAWAPSPGCTGGFSLARPAVAVPVLESRPACALLQFEDQSADPLLARVPTEKVDLRSAEYAYHVSPTMALQPGRAGRTGVVSICRLRCLQEPPEATQLRGDRCRGPLRALHQAAPRAAFLRRHPRTSAGLRTGCEQARWAWHLLRLDAPEIPPRSSPGGHVLVVPSMDAMSGPSSTEHELLLRLRASRTDRWILRPLLRRTEVVKPQASLRGGRRHR